MTVSEIKTWITKGITWLLTVSTIFPPPRCFLVFSFLYISFPTARYSQTARKMTKKYQVFSSLLETILCLVLSSKKRSSQMPHLTTALYKYELFFWHYNFLSYEPFYLPFPLHLLIIGNLIISFRFGNLFISPKYLFFLFQKKCHFGFYSWVLNIFCTQGRKLPLVKH